MSDIRVSMREFRFLEEKRKLTALSQAEEQRWIELGQMLGIFEVGSHPHPLEAQQPQGYYAADGNWYPYAGSTGSFPPEAYAQPAQGAVGTEHYRSDDSGMGELLNFTDSPAEDYAAHSGPIPSGFDQPAGGEHPGFPPPSFDAREQQQNGVSELASDEVMEVDPNDVFLVEHGEGDNASPVAEHPGPASQAVAPTTSPEHSAADGGAVAQSEASLPLTQSYEWIPPAPAGENAIPLDVEAPAVAADADLAVTAEQPAPQSDSVEPSDAVVPLTKNFEWIPAASPPEGAVPLNEGWSDAAAGVALETVQANAGSPQPVEEALASESPVIDLLESDAMQAEVQPSSWEDQILRPAALPAAETGIGDAPSAAEPMEIEPVAQWTGEPEPAAPAPSPEQPEPISTEGAGGQSESFPGDASSAPPPSEVSSSASLPSSIQFVSATTFEPPPQAPPSEAHSLAPEKEIAPQAEGTSSSPPSNAADAQPSEWQDSPSANMPAAWTSEASQRAPAPSVQFGDGKELLSSSFVQGDRRVVIHLLDGQVKRGSLRDVDLMASHVPLCSSTGAMDSIPLDRIKAIFFMVAPGSPKQAPQGQKVRLTFQDGREVIGFSTDYKTGDPGFFVTPADTRTNTERIFVLRWSILTIDEQ